MGARWTGTPERRYATTCSHLSSLDVLDGRRCDCDEPRVETPLPEPWWALLLLIVFVVGAMLAVVAVWP